LHHRCLAFRGRLTGRSVKHALPGSSEYSLYYVARNARQPRIQTLKLHGEPLVVDTEQVQHGCVKIVNAHRIFLRRVPEVVRGSIRDAALDAAARHHEREAFDVMIAAIT